VHGSKKIKHYIRCALTHTHAKMFYNFLAQLRWLELETVGPTLK